MFSQNQITVQQPQQMHQTAVSHILAASVQGPAIQTHSGQMATHTTSLGHQIGMSIPQQPIQVLQPGYQFQQLYQSPQMLFHQPGNLTLQPFHSPHHGIQLQLPTHATGISMAAAPNNKMPIVSKGVSLASFGPGSNIIHSGKPGMTQNVQMIRSHMVANQLNQSFPANGNQIVIRNLGMPLQQTPILPNNNKTLVEQKGKSYVSVRAI